MLSLEKSKQILQANGRTYTDEEAKQIRQVLYKLATLEYQLFKSLNKKQDGERDFIRKSQH